MIFKWLNIIKLYYVYVWTSTAEESPHPLAEFKICMKPADKINSRLWNNPGIKLWYLCVCVCVDRLSGVSAGGFFFAVSANSDLSIRFISSLLYSRNMLMELSVSASGHILADAFENRRIEAEHLLRRMDEMTIDNGFFRRKFENDIIMNLNELLKILIEYWIFFFSFFFWINYCQLEIIADLKKTGF